MLPPRFRTFAVLLIGTCLGAAVHALLLATGPRAVAQPASSQSDAPSLTTELKTIQGKLPDQSHVMKDVGYHFANLWFAGQQENWELANFYFSETKSHLHWAVRIIPIRKDNAGQDVDLGAILEALENGPLKQLQDAIADRNKPAFNRSYRFTIEGCYSCHKASDKPFLRLQVPAQPEAPIVNFDPHATWPR
jgi:hypothetical protein